MKQKTVCLTQSPWEIGAFTQGGINCLITTKNIEPDSNIIVCSTKELTAEYEKVLKFYKESSPKWLKQRNININANHRNHLWGMIHVAKYPIDKEYDVEHQKFINAYHLMTNKNKKYQMTTKFTFPSEVRKYLKADQIHMQQKFIFDILKNINYGAICKAYSEQKILK